MDIVITDVRVTASQQMVFELFRAGIKEIQPPVFGSNPDVTVGIFAELADYISRQENVCLPTTNKIKKVSMPVIRIGKGESGSGLISVE